MTFDYGRVIQNIKFRIDDEKIEVETYVKELKKPYTNEDMIIEFSSKLIKNTEVFYTDSNGLKMIKRVRSTPINIGKSYYPVNSAIYIEDDILRLT